MEDNICDGVKILCERMDSNPEDFTEYPIDAPSGLPNGMGKFHYDGRLIERLARGEHDAHEAYWYLTQAEKDALISSYKKMMRQEFTRATVEKLLEQPESELDVAKAVRKANRPLTKAQMTNESLKLLNESFDEAFSKNHVTDSLVYKATGRYDPPWK